jgi:ADP-ribosyl-[dinitrogen reductase] hydrolase
MLNQAEGDAATKDPRREAPMTTHDRFLGCLVGLAVGDAVGTTLEFKPRGSFKPITDMLGGGPFGLRAGQWTDDTSMALCLASSLVEKGGFDPADQMRRYVRWHEEGYWSATGSCFDIGGTTARALARFKRSREPFAGSDDPYSAGNGSIMRLAPVPMFFAGDIEKAVHYSAESSRTTHGAGECVDACRLLDAILVRALAGVGKDQILMADAPAFSGAARIVDIARGAYRSKAEPAIKGSAYVVDSLEAALWCFDRTGSYDAAVLRAANLGDDADTTAAVCGQVAGAYYGISGIRPAWLEQLAMRADIEELASKLLEMAAVEWT